MLKLHPIIKILKLKLKKNQLRSSKENTQDATPLIYWVLQILNELHCIKTNILYLKFPWIVGFRHAARVDCKISHPY